MRRRISRTLLVLLTSVFLLLLGISVACIATNYALARLVRMIE